MNVKRLISLVAVIILAAAAPVSVVSADSRVGAGFHYWQTIDDIDLDDIDEDGISWLISYKSVQNGLLHIVAELEFLPDNFAGAADQVYAPEVFLIVGQGLYAGLGTGIYFTDGDFADKPFFVLRAGVDLELLPSIFLDVNANYRFDDWDAISSVHDDVDTDTVTLGASVRIQL